VPLPRKKIFRGWGALYCFYPGAENPSSSTASATFPVPSRSSIQFSRRMMISLFLPSRLFNPHHWLLDHLSFYHICSTDTGWISLHHLQSKRLITKHSKSIHGHMLTGQMLTPLSKNRTNAHKIWFWRGKFVNMDIDVIWLITFTARCTI